MAAKDIIINDNNDLVINQFGDFDVKESDQQHIVLIINTAQGNWKQYPLLGVGIINYLKSSGQQQVLRRVVSVQMQSDGYELSEIIFKGDLIYYIDAKRITNE